MLGEKESSIEDRLNYFFLNLIGQVVTVYFVDGTVLEGLFIAVDDDKKSMILSKARRCTSLVHSSDDPANVRDKLKILLNTVVMMDATQVAFRNSAPNRGASEPLRGPTAVKNQRWADVVDDEGEELESGKGIGKWDQFAENEKKFGVKSTYHEELYTTKLNKEEFSKEQHDAAERLAREIQETAATGGIQHRVERGELVDADEDALYSGVARGPATRKDAPPPKPAAPVVPLKSSGAGAYVPPGRRSEAPGTAPATIGAADAVSTEDRAAHMTTTQPTTRTQVAEAPSPVAAAGPASTSGSEGKKSLLNAGASEWKPTGTPASPTAQPAFPAPSEEGPKVIVNMLEEMAKALEANATQIKSCSPDWPGDDTFYDDDDGRGGGFGGQPYPYASHPGMNAFPPAMQPPHHGHGGAGYPPQPGYNPSMYTPSHQHQPAPHTMQHHAPHMGAHGPQHPVHHPHHGSLNMPGGMQREMPPQSMPQPSMQRHMDPSMGQAPYPSHSGRGGLPTTPQGLAGRGGGQTRQPQQPIAGPASVGAYGGHTPAAPAAVDVPPDRRPTAAPATGIPGRGRGTGVGTASGMPSRGGGAGPIEERSVSSNPPGGMLDPKAKRK